MMQIFAIGYTIQLFLIISLTIKGTNKVVKQASLYYTDCQIIKKGEHLSVPSLSINVTKSFITNQDSVPKDHQSSQSYVAG